jgi:DNA-binding LacI/PurR family transcriptional regulator
MHGVILLHTYANQLSYAVFTQANDMSRLAQDEKNEIGHGSRRVSSIEVARRAGVSQSAVSRAFTPGASVSEDTRAKVLAAAKELGYRPNVIARSLIRHSTKIIGIAMVRFTNPFYASLLKAFTEKLQGLGFSTMLYNVAGDNQIDTALPLALQYQVDGIIVTSATLTSSLADECAQTGTPVVLFNRYAADSNVHAVGSDNTGGGRMVADALVDAGHRRIAYLAGEESSSTNRDRERGFTERLGERGVSLFLRDCGDFVYDAAFQAAERLLNRTEHPDAIFCGNDLMALAVLDYARCVLGIRVPAELSVIGYDDIEMSAWPKYDLTTIRQPIEAMVDATVEVLLDAIRDPSRERALRLVSVQLIERTSARLANAGRR